VTEVDELPVELVPIGELQLDPENARLHGRRNLDVIMASLHEFGQRKPLVVTRDTVVRAGNGTLTAMREMAARNEEAAVVGMAPVWRKFTHAWVTWFPGTPEQARAYSVNDNRSTDLSEWDNRLLVKQLQAVREHDDALLKAAGYAPDEWTELIESVTRRTSQFGEPEFPGQVPQTGLQKLGEMYAGKGTRSLVFEYPDAVYAWVVEHLSEYRTRHGLVSNAAAFLELVAEVFAEDPPELETAG
jgi:hypothetical protein